MKTPFQTCRFPLAEVLPSYGQAAEYLHLTDEDRPAIEFILEKMEELRHASFEAVGGYVRCDVRAIRVKEGTAETSEGVLHPGAQVCGYLRESSEAALFLCTAGHVFRRQYDEYNREGNILEAYLVDALGSMTVENAMDRIHQQIEAEAALRQLRITNRYSPGYCNWPITDQKALFALVGSNPTGIVLNDSCLMNPLKSVSGIVGIGATVVKRPYGCAVCQNKTCIYRRLNKDKGQYLP